MKLRYRSSNQIQRSELKYGMNNQVQQPLSSSNERRLKKKGKADRLVEMYVADTKRK